MNRRTFLASLASLPVVGKLFATAEPSAPIAVPKYNGPTGGPYEPLYVTGIASERIWIGDFVVWEYPSSPIRVRRCRGREDFDEHACRGNAGVAVHNQYEGGRLRAMTGGVALVRLEGAPD